MTRRTEGAGPSPTGAMRGATAREFTGDNLPAEGAVSVTAEFLATRLRLTERAIRDLAIRGVVVKLGHGTYDLWASIGAYAEHMREAAAARGGHAAGSQLTVERTREAKERADNLALRNAQLTGEMVSAAAVERGWADILRGLRGRLLAVPGRCQQRLGHLTAHDVATIDREVRDALTEVGNDQHA